MKMEQSYPLSEPQKVALDKLTTDVGLQYVEFIMAQVPDALNARLETFMPFETTLVGHVPDQMASDMPTCYVYVSDEEPLPRPLVKSGVQLTPV